MNHGEKGSILVEGKQLAQIWRSGRDLFATSRPILRPVLLLQHKVVLVVGPETAKY